MSERRSRRTRGEKPELVPPKSDEEPELDDNYVDENGNKMAIGAIRGRRRGKRSRLLANSAGSSSSLSQLATAAAASTKLRKTKTLPQQATKKRGRPRGRPPRAKSPSESSTSLSVSGSENDEEEDNENNTNNGDASGSNNASESDDSNDEGSNPASGEEGEDDDDAERDTEDDAPKEALTSKKKPGRKPGKKKQEEEKAKKNTRFCKWCGKMVSTRGFMQHERSCMKKALARGVKIDENENNNKGETATTAAKKRKRKLADKGGTTTDDDSMVWENDDAPPSVTKKGKDTAGEGKTTNSLKNSIKDPPSELVVPTKRKRRKKKPPEEDEGAEKTADDSSSSSATPQNPPKKRGRPPKAKPVVASADDVSSSGEEDPAPKKRGRKPKSKASTADEEESTAPENPPKKRGRPPKAKPVLASVADDSSASAEEKPPKKRGRKPKAKPATSADEESSSAPEVPKKRGRKPKAKTPGKAASNEEGSDHFSEEDLLPLSALATKKPPAPRGRPPASKKGPDGKDKTTPTATTQKKKGPKNSKLSKVAAKAKITPITNFFSPKTGSSPAEPTKSAAPKPASKDEKGGNSEGVPTIVKKKAAPTKKESSATGETNMEKSGSSKTIGEDERQKSTKNNHSALKGAPATKKDGIVDGDGKKMVSSSAPNIDPSKAAKEEPKPNKSTEEEKAVSTKDKALEKKEKNPTKAAVPISRPTRKRKLTMKAAEAAAIISTKNEEKQIEKQGENSVNEVVDKSDSVGNKPVENDEVGESEPNRTDSSVERKNGNELNADEGVDDEDLLKDEKGKGSIVEAAKSAAAATLAMFPLFAKSKSAEGTEAAETVHQSPESFATAIEGDTPSKIVLDVNDGEKPRKENQETPLDDKKAKVPAETTPVSIGTTSEDNDADISNKLESQGGEKVSDEEKEVPLEDTKIEDPANAVPTATETATSGQAEAVASSEEQASAHSSKSPIHEPLTATEKQDSPKSNSRESNKADNVTKTTDQTMSTDSAEVENEEMIDVELNSNDNKPTSPTEEEIEASKKENDAIKEESSSMAIDNVSKTKSDAENNETQLHEEMEPASEANTDSAAMNATGSSSAQEEESPIMSEMKNEDLRVTDPEKSGSTEPNASNGEKDGEKIQESKSISEDLTTNTNRDVTGSDVGNEMPGMDPQQTDATEKLAKEKEAESMDVGESEEKDAVQSSHNDVVDKETLSSTNPVESKKSADQPQPESSIETNQNVISKDSDEDVRNSEVMQSGDTATGGGNGGGSEETSVAVEDKETVVEGNEEKEPGKSEDSDQPTISNAEIVEGISSEGLGNDGLNGEDDSKKSEKDDNGNSAEDIAEAEPSVAKTSQNAEGENAEESSATLKDEAKKPDELAQEMPVQSQSQGPSSTALDESISGSKENMDSSKSPKTALIEEESSPFVDEPSHSRESDSTSTSTPHISVNENSETNSTDQQQQSTESGKDISMETVQPSDTSKPEEMHDEVVAENISNSKNPSQSEKGSNLMEETSQPEPSEIQQELENSVDWKETVSFDTNVENGDKETPKVSEDRSTTVIADEKKGIDVNEVAMEIDEDTQDPESNVKSDEGMRNVATNETPSEPNESETLGAHDKVIENTAAEITNQTESGKLETGSNDEKADKCDLVSAPESGRQEDKENPMTEISEQVENQGHDISSRKVTEGNHAASEADSKVSGKVSDALDSHNQKTPSIDQNELLSEKPSSKEADSTMKSVEKESMTKEQITSSNDNINLEGDKDKLVESIEESEGVSSEQNAVALPQTESKPSTETSASDKIALETEKQVKSSESIAEGGEDNVNNVLVTDTEESEVKMNSSQVDAKTEPAKSIELEGNETQVDEMDARKDIGAVVESLVNSVESMGKKSVVDSADMEIETSPGSTIEANLADAKSKDTEDVETPTEELDSSMNIEVSTEAMLDPENEVSSPKEEMKVSWVALSKAPRQAKAVKDASRFIGHDESKTNRVKMLLYTTGSKIHRGRGFERIFGMYWDAVCLRLSRPLNENALKRCDQAISAFLKSRKLRKIHNKFVMSIMRRALKDRVPYSEISQNIPIQWQDRVKIPHIVTSRKPPKKKTKTFYEELEDDLLQLSSVPHLDRTTPYKERWEFPTDAVDEIQKNPQEGPTVPIASSCIPGALVVDPMLRETVEANGMKVTDSAMWLLTVALKEHIKNILNDSIEYKKGLKKGEVFPQAIHYPNVLASSSNKNRKISKGRSSSASLENGRKKRINSIDLFAALNMLPSGQPSSIGGSVSRMSLEQTFLSGFNSIPSFDTGYAFKDVQGFISNTITDMAKNRKPEEKKAKASHSKATESTNARDRPSKASARKEGNVATPTARQVSLPSSANTSGSIATPMASLESPPLVNNMSPANVQTPVLEPSTLKVEEKQKDAPTSKVNVTVSTQGSENKSLGVNEKPAQTVAAGGIPSQSGPPRSGAGRGAKNLAALMARAAESTSSNLNDSAQDGEKTEQMSNAEMKNATWPSATAKSEPGRPNAEKSTKIAVNQSNDGESSKPVNATSTQASAGAVGNNEGHPVPPRQPIAPVRRGKGKGFGSKDLAAMRARSMTTTQTEGSNNSNPGDK